MDHLTAWFIILVMCCVSTRLSMCEYFHPDQREDLTDRTNCSLAPVDRFQVQLMKKYIDDGNRLIRFKLKILGDVGALGETYPDGLIKRDEWILSTDNSGKSLLFLPMDYIPKSLWTLSFSEKNLDVTLQQTPSNCFGANNTNYTLQEIKNTIRYHLLRNFSFASDEVSEGFEVCNLQIITGTDNKTADLKYMCCSEINSMCETLKSSKWMDAFVMCLKFVQYFAAPLFSPLLIPNSFYKKSIFFFKCFAKNARQQPFSLNIRIDQPDRDLGRTFIRLSENLTLPEFRNTLKDLPTGEHILNINSVNISVDSENLLECGTSPVTLFSFIVNYFGRCMMRREDRYLRSCLTNCPSNVCFDLLKWTAGLMFLLLPWLVIVIFFFIHDLEFEKEISDASNVLDVTITNSNILSLYLFILQGTIILLCIAFVLFYKKLLSLERRHVAHIARSIMLQNTDIADNWTLPEKISKHVENSRICAGLCLPVWSSIKLVQFFVNHIPFFSFSMKAVLFCISLNRDEPQTEIDQAWKRIAIVTFLFCIQLGLFLYFIISFIAAFYIEVLVFTMTGILLNYDDAFKYAMMILLILVYGHRCFSKNVSAKYRVYTKSLFRYLIEKLKDKVQVYENCSNQEIERDSRNMQVNTRYFRQEDDEHDGIAYMTPGAIHAREKFQFFVLETPDSEKQQLIWEAPSLLLFRDISMNNFCSYIQTKLFHRMNLLPKNFCPGIASVLYSKALREFVLVLLFVFFWIIAMFALSRMSELPATAQTIVAVGTGFMPLLVFKDKSTKLSKIEKDYVWQSMFNDTAQQFNEPLKTSDIVVTVAEQCEAGSRDLNTYSIQNTSSPINRRISTDSNDGNSSANIDFVALKSQNECTIYVHKDKVQDSLNEETKYVDGYQQVGISIV